MYGYSTLSSIEAETRALSRRGGRYSDQARPCHTGSSSRHSLCCESLSEERSAGNPHATFCGSRRRVTASGHPVFGRSQTVARTAACSQYQTNCAPFILYLSLTVGASFSISVHTSVAAA